MNATHHNVISRKSLADEVSAKLRRQLADGRYKLNEKLPVEAELMKAFGVGRSTIREAIKILANSGQLRVLQGVGTFVENTNGIKEPLAQRLKRADTQDLDEVRQLLEMKIAEKAALNRTENDLKKIKEWLQLRDRAAKKGSLEECIDADIRFHMAIAEASKNEILADLYTSVATRLRNWFSQVFSDTTAFQKTHHLHQQLVKSIEERDAKKAWNDVARIIDHACL